MARTQAPPTPQLWRNRIVGTAAVDPATLAPHPLNWRRHPEAQKAALRGVLREVGLVQDVLVSQQSGRLLDGHLRVALALEEHQSTIPVKYVDLSEAEERLVLATLDPLAALAETDAAALQALLAEVTSGDAGVQTLLQTLAQETGLAPGEAAPLENVEPQLDRAEALREQWGVEVGQLWQLGSHRVLCGDCTEQEQVKWLLEGATFRLLVTSPPYTDQRTYTLGEFDWLTLAERFMAAAVPSAGQRADVLVNLGLSHKNGRVDRYWEPWLDTCETLGWPVYGWYVWDKLSSMPGERHGRLAPCHEWLFHFSSGHVSAQKWITTTQVKTMPRFRKRDGTVKDASSPETIGQPYKIPDSVVRVRNEHARGLHTATHPAVFPVDLPAFCLQTWSEPGSFVYDPFLGSGTTLIACEQLGRRCYGLERAPQYVAVTLQRSQDLTGQTPTRLA